MRDYTEAEKFVAECFEKAGYKAILQKPNNKAYDIIVTKGEETSIVQVKNLASRPSEAVVQKFNAFLESEGNIYSKGYLICKSGFGRKVYDNYDHHEYSDKLQLGLFVEEEKPDVYFAKSYEAQKACKFVNLKGEIVDFGKEEPAELISQQPLNPIRIAIATCKGGVGKTTVSAHLAGAFSLVGFSVSLVDCDKDQYSLLKLLDPDCLKEDSEGIGEGILLDDGAQPISCYSKDAWEKQLKDNSLPDPIVIYDCSPKILTYPEKEEPKNRNDAWIFENSDICIIPVSMCPLGIGKNLDIIRETFQRVQSANPKIRCFVLENNKLTQSKENKRVSELRRKVQAELSKTKAYLLSDELAIRHSEKLYYWGFDEKKLAFNNDAGARNLPKDDFMELADWLIKNEKLREKANEFLKNQKLKEVSNKAGFSNLQKFALQK